MKNRLLPFTVIVLLIGGFAIGADDQPIKVEPQDFKFVAKVLSPPAAVKAEEEAWRNGVRLKYSGKTVSATGLLFKSAYRGDDCQVSIVKKVPKSKDGRPPQKPPPGSFPVYVKLAASGFELSRDMLGKVRTVTGTARVQSGRGESLYLRIEGARLDD